MIHSSINPKEIEKFDHFAKDWWDPNGSMKMLHQLNPLRLHYIETLVGSLSGKKILDVGCGGGILSESMAKKKGIITAIDLSSEALKTAREHAAAENVEINYLQLTAEEMAAQHPQQFDVITCMEMLEHVPNPYSIIKACSDLIRPKGMIIFSTINRNLKSFFGAIVAAEYLLSLLPKGTHHYAQFIRPSEITQWSNQNHLTLLDLKGIYYNWRDGTFSLTTDVDINYLITFTK